MKCIRLKIYIYIYIYIYIFVVHQQGATYAEIGKCDDKPMSYVATLHFVRNQITYKIITVPTPTVAWTRA